MVPQGYCANLSITSNLYVQVIATEGTSPCKAYLSKVTSGDEQLKHLRQDDKGVLWISWSFQNILS